MAFKKEAFNKYGLFRTDMGPSRKNPMGKGEDSEFSSRLLAAGETLMYVPDALVYHPGEKEGMQKRYFKTWYFNFGRAWIPRYPPPEWAVHCFGVPRYMFRHFILKFLRWFFAFDGHRRFCNKLELYQVA